MQNGGAARFAGDVVMVTNPTPPDLSEAVVEAQGTVLVLRVALPAGGDEGDVRVSGQIMATVTYGPDHRTASGSVGIPTDDLDAVKRSAMALVKRFGASAQAQAQMNGAEALKVARQNGEYRGGK